MAIYPLFGSVLKLIQRNYNELLVNETNYLKEVNKQLSDEIDIIKDKYEKLIEQLKAQNEIDSKEFSKELGILQNRNKMLTDDIRNLESELQKANEREEMLEALLKDDEDNNANTKPKENVIHEKISKKKKKIKIGAVEVGKNKVKIPILDFTDLKESEISKKSKNIEEGNNEILSLGY